MTIEELSQLSDEELRVKVAEKLGFNRKEHWQPFMGGWVNIFTLPPFSTSLDAIHEAEATLTLDGEYRFTEALGEILRIEKPGIRSIWHATARQRAIAFLMV